MHDYVDSSTKAYERNGFALLVNGNSGSGKTTISKELERRLQEFGLPATHILFDRDRHIFAPLGNYNYTSDEARKQTYINAAHYYREKIMDEKILIIDTGARDDTTRRPLFEIVPNLHLIYLECPLYIRIWRETKRSITGKNREMQRGRFLYAKAYASLIFSAKEHKFPQPGVTIPFEPPLNPNLIIETSKRTIDEEVSLIFTYMQKRGLIQV